MTADALLLANAAATWVMVGVIWFVQLVHYPMFRCYAQADFAATARAHQSATFWVVFPPMIVELVTSLWLLVQPPAGVPTWLPWAAAALVGVWGFSTALVQIPLHEKLEKRGYDAATHQQLVRTNWVRTLAWSLHGICCLAMLKS